MRWGRWLPERSSGDATKLAARCNKTRQLGKDAETLNKQSMEAWRMAVEAMAEYGATTDWKALAAVDAGVASVANASGGVDWSLPGARAPPARPRGGGGGV